MQLYGSPDPHNSTARLSFPVFTESMEASKGLGEGGHA